jgi:hypothetical protein
MRPWSLLLALVGLAAAVAGFAVLATPDDPALAPPTREAAPGRNGDEPPPANAAPEVAASASAPRAVAATAPPDQDEDGTHRDAAGPTGPLGPLVLVVRGPAATPVPGAEVFLIAEPRGAEAQQKSGLPCPSCEWPERFGQRLTTDERGQARLPPLREPWLVAARSGPEFAFAPVPPGRGERTVTLALQTDESVRIRVVDPDGGPGTALPVAVLWHRAGEEQAREIWQGRTDHEGRAECRHFQVLRPPPADGRAETAAVMLALPLPSPVLQGFPPRPAPSTPITLQAPPRTAVEVQLTDHRGAPLLSPATVALWFERPKELLQALPMPPPASLDRGRLNKPPGEDKVTFELVGVDAGCRIAARFPQERRGAVAPPLGTYPDGDGPIRVQLPLGPDLALLAGRVTLDGQPFGPAEIPAVLWRADGPVAQMSVHTLADGRFDLVLAPPPGSPEFWLELRADVPPPVTEPGAPLPAPTGARVWFRALAGGERRELGAIALGPLPPLCSGVVVDDEGTPVADAQVQLQKKNPEPTAPPQPSRNQNEPPPDPWRPLPLLETRTDAEGRFALFGELPRGELRVRADTDQHFADSAPLRAIGQQLRIVLQRNGVLRGRVLLPDWVADGTVSLQLRPVDEALRARDSRTVPLGRRGGGRFQVEPLRPGRYDALVTVRNLQAPLCTVENLFVPPGAMRDPRFQPLDLRQSLFRYRLRAVDFGGNPLALDGPIVARMRQLDGSTTDAGFRWQKGKAEIIAASAMAEIVAFGKGCAPATVTLLPGDHDVFLRRITPALVSLPGARQLAGPTRRVRVSVILTEETGLPQWLQGQDQRTGESFSFPRWELGRSNGAWLGPSDTVEVPVVQSGKYEVVLRLHATDSESSPQASVSLGVHELFVDAGYTAVTRVPIDETKLRQALAQLEGQARAQQPGQRGNRRRD